MLTPKEKELLLNIYNNKKFNYLDFKLEIRNLKKPERDYISTFEADNTIYFISLTEKGKLLVNKEFDESIFEFETSSNSINGNNNNIVINSKIENSFNTFEINNFIEEITNSNEDEELKLLITKWNNEFQELFIELIQTIKSSQGKKSKLETLKNFAIKIGETLAPTMLEQILKIIITYS